MRKGIILSGGSGSRLYPITFGNSKQLLQIYDKPMIYYSLAVLMNADIREILVISSKDFINSYESILKDGAQFGINISYKVQDEPKGIAEAFIIGENFISNDDNALVLGDNFYHGGNFLEILQRASQKKFGATVFGKQVNNPQEFGVVEFNSDGSIKSIHEKPEEPKSDFIITGLYFYDKNVVDIARSIQPSARGELEITDINNEYLKQNLLNIELLNNKCSWFDNGTYDALLDTGIYVRQVQNNDKCIISSPEVIAFQKGWISCDDLLVESSKYKTSYGEYLKKLAENKL